jgi:hypothetical protein
MLMQSFAPGLSVAWDADTRVLYEERVAIMVHDGGLQVAEAERRARKIIEGTSQQPEQLELSTGFQQFREGMQRLWKD